MSDSKILRSLRTEFASAAEKFSPVAYLLIPVETFKAWTPLRQAIFTERGNVRVRREDGGELYEITKYIGPKPELSEDAIHEWQRLAMAAQGVTDTYPTQWMDTVRATVPGLFNSNDRGEVGLRVDVFSASIQAIDVLAPTKSAGTGAIKSELAEIRQAIDALAPESDRTGAIESKVDEIGRMINSIRAPAKKGRRQKYDPAKDAQQVEDFRQANEATGIKMRLWAAKHGINPLEFGKTYNRVADRKRKLRQNGG